MPSSLSLEAHERVLGVEARAVDVLAREVHGVLRGREHGAHPARVLDRECLGRVEAELGELGRHPLRPDPGMSPMTAMLYGRSSFASPGTMRFRAALES